MPQPPEQEEGLSEEEEVNLELADAFEDLSDATLKRRLANLLIQGGSTLKLYLFNVVKEQLDKIIEEYIRLKDWGTPEKEILSSIYQRNCKPAKQLLLLIKDDSKAIEVMGKLAKNFGDKGLSWTIETVIKHLPDIISNKLSSTPIEKSQQTSGLDKEIEQKLGKIANKDQIKDILKKTPKQYWYKVKFFLTRRYPADGQKGYYNAESELRRE